MPVSQMTCYVRLILVCMYSGEAGESMTGGKIENEDTANLVIRECITAILERCVCVCVRACVRACVRVYESVCLCMHASALYSFLFVCACMYTHNTFMYLATYIVHVRPTKPNTKRPSTVQNSILSELCICHT